MQAPYFSSLTELDTWAAGCTNQKLNGILEYAARPTHPERRTSGKLLVCHDYKGGYTESPSSLSYTFNFWSSCDTFVYFSHHRVTVPPPGWITAAHRQGVKMLGTLIFEDDDEEDCLRLLVGNLPSSINGPAKPTPQTTAFPLSPHYAKLLAELACQRGFDGYLLNFECPLQGGVEQSRTLAAWITLLQNEILAKVGSHGEIVWYDSVIFNGQLAWQDRLNSLNLPFFLSSSSLFSNYTWPPHYPNATAEYFLALDPALTGNAPDSQPQVSRKSMNDIYMGVDVWGRGSHGGGGFGSYKAITHIAPDSLSLSVALFGQGWTWESEQDKPGWNWDKWWEYESKLWVGPVSGEVEVPEAPRRKGEPECPHGPFQPLASFFPRNPPPDPLVLPFHTTFSPGVGRAWFVNGVRVNQTMNGWTNVDKQCSVGDLVWPKAPVVWEGGERDDPVPAVLPTIYFEDAWNGGSSLSLRLLSPGSEAEDAVYRCIWVPIQSLALSTGTHYEATLCYKMPTHEQVELDLGLSVKLADNSSDLLHVTPIAIADSELPGGWSKLSIQLFVPEGHAAPARTGVGLGLVIAIVAEDPSHALDATIFVGQMNVYAVPPQTAAVHTPTILWANFVAPTSKNAPGTLSWDVGVSFPPLSNVNITSPDDPISAWTVHPSNKWFPEYMYFNVYALMHDTDSGNVGQPEDALWIGTTGLDGVKNSFAVVPQELPFWSQLVDKKTSSKVRFYVQGVTDRGVVLGWDKCAFVDCDLAALVI